MGGAAQPLLSPREKKIRVRIFGGPHDPRARKRLGLDAVKTMVDAWMRVLIWVCLEWEWDVEGCTTLARSHQSGSGRGGWFFERRDGSAPRQVTSARGGGPPSPDRNLFANGNHPPTVEQIVFRSFVRPSVPIQRRALDGLTEDEAEAHLPLIDCVSDSHGQSPMPWKTRGCLASLLVLARKRLLGDLVYPPEARAGHVTVEGNTSPGPQPDALSH